MNWVDRIDWIIGKLKWPAAVLACLSIPLLLWALVALFGRILASPWGLIPFLLGMIGFFALWRRWLGKSRIGKWLINFEHELTHAMFAWVTGHSIIDFRASMGEGSEVRFTGHGNWLILIAPYFFPTAAVVLFLMAYVMPFSALPWSGFLLGVALGYHVISTYRETHGNPSDLKHLGRRFCWMFLPASNLAVLGLIISFAHGGSQGVNQWTSDVFRPIGIVWNWRNTLPSPNPNTSNTAEK